MKSYIATMKVVVFLRLFEEVAIQIEKPANLAIVWLESEYFHCSDEDYFLWTPSVDIICADLGWKSWTSVLVGRMIICFRNKIMKLIKDVFGSGSLSFSLSLSHSFLNFNSKSYTATLFAVS